MRMKSRGKVIIKERKKKKLKEEILLPFKQRQ